MTLDEVDPVPDPLSTTTRDSGAETCPHSTEVADSEDPIEVDGSTEYVIKVGNQGTKPATGVRISAALLGDLEPVEARGPVQHRIEARGVAFEPLAKLAPSEEAVFRIRVKGRRAGDHVPGGALGDRL